jgi:hypothetical protein
VDSITGLSGVTRAIGNLSSELPVLPHAVGAGPYVGPGGSSSPSGMSGSEATVTKARLVRTELFQS